MMPPIAKTASALKMMRILARKKKQEMANCKPTTPSPEVSPLPVVPNADPPKHTILTGFSHTDYRAEDNTPKYLGDYLYCHNIDKKYLSKGFLPRCQLLEQIYKDATISDMFFPPNFPKPIQSKSSSEYKLAVIGQLISYLNWWVQEKIEREHPIFWFYAYSYTPCQRRAAFVNLNLENLITEFNFSHQTSVAEELKKLASNLDKKAIEWDDYARIRQQSEYWIDPSRLNPVEVKWAAAALLNKLRHVGSMVREQNANLSRKKKKNKKMPKPACQPSEDYTSVVWFGKKYSFNKTQALCVKYLWAEWKKGEGLGLSEKTIGEKIGSASDNYKLKHTFRVRHGKKYRQHSAWGKMIVSCGKGKFCLKSPKK